MTRHALMLLAAALLAPPAASAATEVVGRQADGSVLLPSGQRIRPAGRNVELAGSPTGVAVAPDGRTAVVHLGSHAGHSLYVVALPGGEILQAYDDKVESASFAGVTYAPDGRHLFSSSAGGTVAITDVAAGGTLGATRKVAIPADATKVCCGPYPGGLAVAADGRTAYVALSVNNTLGVIDVASATLTAQIPVGNAPHAVVVDGGRAYVSNEGGRPAAPGDFTARSGGTAIVADPFTAESVTGTVSVVDLTAGKEVASVPVGVHPTALALDGDHLYVADTNGDTVSDVDLERLEVARTIPVSPYDGAAHGSMPNGLAVLPGHRLAVTLGRDNAMAVLDIGRVHARALGLLPVGWFPAGVAFGGDRIVVANNQGVGSLADADNGAHARGVGGEIGSVSILRVPRRKDLRAGTRAVGELNRWNGAATKPAGRPPIDHVVYIIRENRTYDQILGDIGRGDSDPSLVNFGAEVTPNAHALATEFPLLDNFYVSGRRSNDGHQWAVGAQNADYFQKSNGNNKRSELNAPSSGFDSLLYTPSGFLWENALRHGKTFDDYGEYTKEDVAPPAYSDIPSLQAHVAPEFPGFQLQWPDQLRARTFATHLAGYEAAGEMPNLILLTLSNDHTGGSDPLYDTPEAEVADNDAALGRIVDDLSHSSFWPATAIFVAEDDAQGGADHVDGHRSPAFVIGPYVKRRVLDSSFYSQVSIVRTIEDLLGLPPMNHLDAATPPMRGLFTSKPDLTPFDAIAPKVGTDIPNPPLSALRGMRREWAAAMAEQDLRHLDAADQQMLKRDIWYRDRGYSRPFPGDRRVLHPAEVHTSRASAAFGTPAVEEEEKEGE
jgi:YVTN family beta-propeller protein